jgi:hypothetical protein
MESPLNEQKVEELHFSVALLRQFQESGITDPISGQSPCSAYTVVMHGLQHFSLSSQDSYSKRETIRELGPLTMVVSWYNPVGARNNSLKENLGAVRKWRSIFWAAPNQEMC